MPPPPPKIGQAGSAPSPSMLWWSPASPDGPPPTRTPLGTSSGTAHHGRPMNYTVRSGLLQAESARSAGTAMSHASHDSLAGIGATNRWERVPATYGISSVRARIVKSGADGAAFLTGGRRRHGLAEWLRKGGDQGDSGVIVRLRELVALLDDGADPNVPIKVPWRFHRTTALFECAINGDLELCSKLLEHGAAPNETVGPGFSALYNSALLGHSSIVCLLLDQGASVEVSTRDGLTPLYAASQEGHMECVEALLRAPGMSVRVAERQLPTHLGGASALYVAAQAGQPEVVASLLDYGLEVDAPTAGERSTALMIAMYIAARTPTQPHLRCIGQLLRRGASLDLIDANGRSALSWAPTDWHAALRAAGVRGPSGDAEDLVREIERLRSIRAQTLREEQEGRVHRQEEAARHQKEYLEWRQAEKVAAAAALASHHTNQDAGRGGKGEHHHEGPRCTLAEHLQACLEHVDAYAKRCEARCCFGGKVKTMQ